MSAPPFAYVCDCGLASNSAGGHSRHTCVGTPCRDCGDPMRPQKTSAADFPGTREHKGNRICNRCWRRRSYGRTDDPATPKGRAGIPAESVLDDWVLLRDDGYSIRDAAPRIGTTPGALEKALYRARRRGDPRGSVVPFGHDMRRPA